MSIPDTSPTASLVELGCRGTDTNGNSPVARCESILLRHVEHRRPTTDGGMPGGLRDFANYIPMAVVLLFVNLDMWKIAGGIAAIMGLATILIRKGRDFEDVLSDWKKGRRFHAASLMTAMLLFMPVAGVFMLPGCLLDSLANSRRRDERRKGELPLAAPDAKARLTCYGELDELRRVHLIGDVPFEPVILQHYWVRWSPRMVIWGGLFIIALWMVGLIMSGSLLRPWIGVRAAEFLRSYFMGCAGFVGIPLVALGYFAAKAIYPRYFRIVPGRMDVMDFNFWGTRAVRVQSVNLRTAKVLVRYDQQYCEIESTECTGERLKVDFAGMSEWHRFCEAVFRAAVSTTQTPTLPSDVLLG